MKLLTNKPLRIITLAVVCLGFFAGCDPCKEYAEKVCSCKATENERKECLETIKLAKEHQNFNKAAKPEVCRKALKECTCQKINSQEFDGCGFYRNN